MAERGETFEKCRSGETQTDLTSDDFEDINRKCDDSEAIIGSLKVQINSLSSSEFSRHNIEGDDDRVRFYTGLPTWMHLLSLFNFVLQGQSTGEVRHVRSIRCCAV